MAMLQPTATPATSTALKERRADLPRAGNASWTAISKGTFNGFIVNGLTGATKLQLPFVQAGVGPIEITRKPQPTDIPLMTNSRLYKKSEIRILLEATHV